MMSIGRWRFLGLIVSMAGPALGQCETGEGPRVDRDELVATSGFALNIQETGRPIGAGAGLQVGIDAGLVREPASGRLVVILGPANGPEPRLIAGRTGEQAIPMFGVDVEGMSATEAVRMGPEAAAFPVRSLADVPAGSYLAQAVLMVNRDLWGLNMPGNLYSEPLPVVLGPDSRKAPLLKLSREVPEPPTAEVPGWVKPIAIRSEKLSRFHGRDIILRASVLLPKGFEEETERRYPLRVHIGGFGARSASLAARMRRGSSFRRFWESDDTPRMLMLSLDGAGPLGDPYQVNSDNHGPWGDALTEELIPYVEREFRGLGRPEARFLDGGSTGGWVSMALQVFYPDHFNGTWSFCPDALDFRNFQLVNIYEDDNAYVGADGSERAACRGPDGGVEYTMRHECAMENVLGRGDDWSMSGGQWGSWNATYGPRGADGRPVPLWDPRTGKIDRAVAEHWEKYDLRKVLEENWDELAPKLRGKIHIWVGEADDYFLEDAVHRLDEFLKRARPSYEGSIEYGPGEGHCWMGISEGEMMRRMSERAGGG